MKLLQKTNMQLIQLLKQYITESNDREIRRHSIGLLKRLQEIDQE